MNTKAANFNARFSPDGQALAYTSDEAGQYDVYVIPFPVATTKWKVSTQGGAQSVWRRDGRELFYVAPDRTMMSVAVTGQGGALMFGRPTALFKIPSWIRSPRPTT
jgi:eukaryotic-like serine/threonine-protein kinase